MIDPPPNRDQSNGASTPRESPVLEIDRMRSVLILVAVLEVLLGSETQAARGVAREMNDLVRPYLDAQQSHALTVGLWLNGKSYLRGYGQYSETDDRKPDGETVYEVGAISRLFTGALLADAVVRGDVKLDQPASKLLPSGVSMPQSGSRPITLLDLATGLSGLPKRPADMPGGSKDPYAGYTEPMMMEFLNRHELRRQPGVEYEYSPLSFGLLGKLLARRANTDYETLLNNRLVKPLRLKGTSIVVPEDRHKDLAPPHRSDLEPATPWRYGVLAGGGGVHSTAKDLLLLASRSIAPPRNRLGAALDLAWSPHTVPVKGTDYQRGLGWTISSDGTTHWVSDSHGGYHGTVFASRKWQVAVVALANSQGLDSYELALRIFRAAIGGEIPEPSCESPPEVPLETMRQYVGRYENAAGKVYDVHIDGEKLFIGYTRSTTYRVFPVTQNQWRYRSNGATITFRQNEASEWDSLEYIRTNRAETANRIAQDVSDEGPDEAANEADPVESE